MGEICTDLLIELRAMLDLVRLNPIQFDSIRLNPIQFYSIGLNPIQLDLIELFRSG